MTAIDRAALIGAAAKAISIYQGSYLYIPDAQQPIRPTTKQTRLAEAAAPVIVAAVLKPLRELHRGKHLDDGTDPSGPWCLVCLELDPCRTMEMLDQIEADVKGDER